VGVIGGGDSAIDAARVAMRQENVDSVTIFYRRTRNEMPAIAEEIDSALAEGIKLETLVSPVRIKSRDNKLSAVEFIRNELGEFDSSGRRHPKPVSGTEFTKKLDTLIATIGDQPDIEFIPNMGIELTKWGTIQTDAKLLTTNRPGVFAGGDVVTGPNTVVEAIAAGKKIAGLIDAYVHDKDLDIRFKPEIPEQYIEPPDQDAVDENDLKRVQPSTIPMELRVSSFQEVEKTINENDAISEAKRCLRCDLDFTIKNKSTQTYQEIGGKTA
jgi:NADH-quinone oxidoreductase subunit F